MAHSTPDVVVLDEEEASLARRQSIINDACRYLIEIGFPSDIFTLKKIHENGYIDKEFLELLDPIYLMQEDGEELARLFECINPKNDLGKFLERMEFLNTKKGRLPIAVALTRMKMKNINEMPQEYVDLAQNLVSSTATLKSTHGDILDQIYDLERKAFHVDQQLKTKLGPLYGYQEPSTRELRLLAYKLYEDRSRSENITFYPIHYATGFDIAINKYGAVAKNLHLLSYLNEPTRRSSIIKYLKEIRSLGFAGEKDSNGEPPVIEEEEEVSSSDSKRKRAPSTTEQLSDDEQLPKRTVLTNVSEEVSDSKKATSGNEPATTK